MEQHVGRVTTATVPHWVSMYHSIHVSASTDLLDQIVNLLLPVHRLWTSVIWVVDHHVRMEEHVPTTITVLIKMWITSVSVQQDSLDITVKQKLQIRATATHARIMPSVQLSTPIIPVHVRLDLLEPLVRQSAQLMLLVQLLQTVPAQFQSMCPSVL